MLLIGTQIVMENAAKIVERENALQGGTKRVLAKCTVRFVVIIGSLFGASHTESKISMIFCLYYIKNKE